MPGRELLIGLNEQNEIVIHFDALDDVRVWHATFTAKEARALAHKLLKFADEAHQLSRGEALGGIGR